jgi:hypothetical protein
MPTVTVVNGADTGDEADADDALDADDTGADEDEDEQAVAVSAAMTMAATAPARPRLGMLNITLLGWVLRWGEGVVTRRPG